MTKDDYILITDSLYPTEIDMQVNKTKFDDIKAGNFDRSDSIDDNEYEGYGANKYITRADYKK